MQEINMNKNLYVMSVYYLPLSLIDTNYSLHLLTNLSTFGFIGKRALTRICSQDSCDPPKIRGQIQHGVSVCDISAQI